MGFTRAVFRSRTLPLCLLATGACGKGGSGPAVPEPALSGSVAAQRAFRRIEARWIDKPESRARLDDELRVFLRQHGTDGRARLARVYLAWIEIEGRRPRRAEALLAEVRRGPGGAVRDLADVAAAAALRQQGNVKAALALLEPLRGKIADPVDRALYSEELVRALVESKRFDVAISAMLDWAEQASPTEREVVIASIEALIRSMPAPALEAGLRSLGDEERRDSGARSTRAEARRWLTSAVQGRLVRVALTERDAELARRLLDTSPVRLGRDEARDALVQLAQASSVAARVAGRSVGVVLDVADDVARRRSAEVVRGMTRALGLPESAVRPDAVRLLTRDAEEPGEVDRALAGLAGDGAAILVAGVTDEAAVAASLFAERTRTPVMILGHPRLPDAERAPFTFVLGADPASEEAAVAAALTSAGARSPVRIGPGGYPCDAVSKGAAETRFPVESFRRVRADAVLLLGDAACAREAAAEVSGVGLSPLFVFGLEAAEAKDTIVGRRAVVSTGRFPLGTHPLTPEERTWVTRFGATSSWHATLGRDAAMLAAAVLSTFPLERAEAADAVLALHKRARDGLARARAPLWSTAAKGFEGGNLLSRELRPVLVDETGGRPP